MGAILDKRTVITAGKVLEFMSYRPDQLLVLAGSLKPWWGDKSQVRKVEEIKHSKYEIVLLKLKEAWVFNPLVSSIKLPKKFYSQYNPIFGRYTLIFGVHLGENRGWGEVVPKSRTYYASLNRAVHENWENCEDFHPDLVFPFNRQVHYCIYPNDSFCHGSIGSPAVGVTTMGEIYIIGVVIRTACTSYSIIVKITFLDKWIRSNSLLGYFMLETD